MAARIIPRLVRGRLHFRTADALFPAFAQGAWTADAYPVGSVPTEQCLMQGGVA